MPSFSILTFGCKVNQCDSQAIRETLTAWGLDEAHSQQGNIVHDADLVVINTCTVTSAADAKFRKALRRVKREKPGALIAVTGCYANRALSLGTQIPEADIILDGHDLSSFFHVLMARLPGQSETGPLTPSLRLPDEAMQSSRPQSYFANHTRAFLKIQDGCDSFCTYCVVPLARPTLWSEHSDKVTASINSFSAAGYKEVVLTGIHLGFFGRDSGSAGIQGLLNRIEQECRIERVRLSSIEVNEVTDHIVELMARSSKLCHHLHLPLQSGDDEVLRRMGRKYSSGFFAQRVEQIRAEIPDIGITADVMVGFPGETDSQFKRTCQFVSDMGFTKIHVFRYSPRPGTEAADMDEAVSPRIISERAKELIGIGERTARSFKARFFGKSVSVLTETPADSGQACFGLTSNYMKVKVSGVSDTCMNRIISVRLHTVDEHTGILQGCPM
ncbi:MAG: tRNA (N(6)-L-threonylcarbamoyladenosine(37)-C(2))-methylthiotransferase MtaB [Candidatus Abyssobacteria bacterium SURF_17]|uniref:tRNA (N(6)-L-threonylcarbamoyladenosine(37)-C(2))-methylthiotransferase MtaB n=1 Tax=Candidatus Abyssobacteria bacterium SURF_17 TaxID=2093361 RepID=A0A419EXN9_9BACT|nr:MAG: tRNA (N(6)-L-threonylcarbamoyladenosine(37)-C(2))-methylthiotransferase MtaB [Candidatus Abyssubacteria bacterium SURF_17]